MHVMKSNRRCKSWMTAFQERLGVDKRRTGIWQCGMRRVVEAKRKERATEREHVEEEEQDKNVSFR